MSHLSTTLAMVACLLVATNLIGSAPAAVTSNGAPMAAVDQVASSPTCTQDASKSKLTCQYLTPDSMDLFKQALTDASFYFKKNIILVIKSSDLTGLPNDIFSGVPIVTLKLASCSLTAIPWAALSSVPSGLTKLIINGNNIATIDVPQFKLKFLGTLTSLDFSSNNAKSIASYAFKQYTALQTLTLTSNALTDIESGQLDGLTALTTLTISENQLEKVALKTFLDLTSVTNLDLSGNLITAMANGTFDGLDAVTGINLYEVNPFNCDCSLQWLKVWLNSRDLDSGAKCTPATNSFANDGKSFCT